FTIREESGVAGDGRAVELQLDFAIEINAHGVVLAVTHWVPLSFRHEVVGNAGFSGERRKPHAETTVPSGKSGFKEDRTLFMLYESSVEYYLVPKRLLTATQIEEIRDQLKRLTGSQRQEAEKKPLPDWVALC